MTLQGRLLVSFVTVLTVPLGGALLLTDLPLTDELAVFGVAIVLGAGLAVLATYALTRPLGDLAAGAERFAAGDFSTRIPVRTNDEVGQLARAFNDVSDQLRRQVVDVEVARDQLRKALRRLGEALGSTADLRQTLSVVLETAMLAVHAKRGAVWLLTPGRNELYVKVGRNLGPETVDARIGVGEGVAGWVASRTQPALVPSSSAPSFASVEPSGETCLAVPLQTQTQLLGVIALYGRDVPEPFGDEELESIRSLSRQAGIGVENVLLHDEAKRLSITDGLTGSWNYRFLQMRLAQEFQRAIRFQRPLTLLMIDIDHFKEVNDRYGHQRGDAVLIELVRRILAHTRLEVDTLARYGGEEFVLILPETGIDGARVAAEKIRHDVADTPFGVDKEYPLAITVSIGFAAYPEHGLTPQVLLNEADQAMYLAKARGRNQVAGAEELKTPARVSDPTR